MSPKGHNTDLARLLDGELHDVHEVEQINSAIQADPELRAEFDEQRSIKSLLGELDEYEAPDFMATRIMGEISAKRNASRRVAGWRQALAAIGGLGVVAVLAFSMTTRNAAVDPNTGSNAIATSTADPGKEYSDAYWTKPDFESSIKDEKLRNLLEFASDAHRRSELEHLAGSDTPNTDDLVIMVGEGGISR